jgi:MFS family permease
MLAGYALYVGLPNFGVPAWQSWLGDLVPANRRGRWFGLRNALCGGVYTATFIIAGWWLVLCRNNEGFALLGLSGRNFGFLVLFAVAGVARLVSTWYLSRMYDVPYTPQPKDRFTLLDFIRRAPRAHFGRFVLYLTLVHVGYGFMGPFYGWYLLDQCQFTTGVYANVLVVGLAISVCTQALWGRLADRVGNKRIITICGIGAIFFPLWLLFCRSPWHFAAAQFYDGVMTAGFAIATGNYIFDVVSPPKRARCVAYCTLFTTIGITIGAFPGALVAKYVSMPLALGPLSITHAFQLLLVGSVTLRLLANVLMLGSFQEFRLSRPEFVPEGRRAA